jgi:5-formyltetrahydrofolate cyclo-ligase
MGKAELRKEILTRLKAQDAKLKAEKDKKIKDKFLALAEFKEAKTIAFYVSFASEVDTKALIDEALKLGKRVVVPVVKGDGMDMCDAKDRDKRPFPKEKIDLVVTPGVAFAKSGQRLGRGKGYYDRFLKSLAGRARKIGLAYSLQIVEDLPADPHDIPVDLVITD